MGDISTEPSMEEILSSIKRIIAEEGDAAVATRTRRGRGTGAPAPRADVDEVLELSDPVAEELPVIPQEKPMPMGSPTPPEPVRAAEPILSDRTAEATRVPLEALSRMVVKPDVPGSDTLEGMVREMLKPMLSEWLDANLPRVVESMVAKEISRITGRD
ncbi:DUF2497 domain-containing protein [Sphingomonas soli]|uniref:DUF2497 domain-containing protein n=1 Tax=Sphingomonas soli TaxID=266127 RepID=UPI00082B29C2|nr:DUF2497 domain-containing protein [Sphingomonas soli]